MAKRSLYVWTGRQFAYVSNRPPTTIGVTVSQGGTVAEEGIALRGDPRGVTVPMHHDDAKALIGRKLPKTEEFTQIPLGKAEAWAFE